MEKAGVRLLSTNEDNRLNRPGDLSAIVLAYIGDAVYELAVRSHLVNAGLARVNQLHGKTVKCVNAGAQAKVLEALEGSFTEEEAAVVRRGRNAKSSHVPRGTGMIEYRRSTAFESLIGYLYLKGDTARLGEIMAVAFEVMKET